MTGRPIALIQRLMLPPWMLHVAVGSRLKEVREEAGVWHFGFAGWGVSSPGLWRLADADWLVLTSEDDGQRFGLPAPVDAARQVLQRLNAAVVGVEIAPRTLDLAIRFADGCTLELVNTSCGYEGWHARVAMNDPEHELIALPGRGVTEVTAGSRPEE